MMFFFLNIIKMIGSFRLNFQAGLAAYYNGVTNMKRLHYYAINVLNTIEKETGQVC